MISGQERRPVILVIDVVEETRHGIKRLLTTSGYLVTTAGGEEEAFSSARFQRPDLVLICLGLDAVHILPVAMRIREGTGLDEGVPVVGFCVASLDEGAEVAAGRNVYMTRPDNFDQLRTLIGRLLRKSPRHG